MNRMGLSLLAGTLIVLPLVGAGCGTGDELSNDPLPPMRTTTTTIVSLTTTTEVTMKVYIVQPGDLLGNIATGFKVSLDDLMAINGITNPDKIQSGQTLKIPNNTVVVFESLPQP